MRAVMILHSHLEQLAAGWTAVAGSAQPMHRVSTDPQLWCMAPPTHYLPTTTALCPAQGSGARCPCLPRVCRLRAGAAPQPSHRDCAGGGVAHSSQVGAPGWPAQPTCLPAVQMRWRTFARQACMKIAS